MSNLSEAHTRQNCGEGRVVIFGGFSRRQASRPEKKRADGAFSKGEQTRADGKTKSEGRGNQSHKAGGKQIFKEIVLLLRHPWTGEGNSSQEMEGKVEDPLRKTRKGGRNVQERRKWQQNCHIRSCEKLGPRGGGSAKRKFAAGVQRVVFVRRRRGERPFAQTERSSPARGLA